MSPPRLNSRVIYPLLLRTSRGYSFAGSKAEESRRWPAARRNSLLLHPEPICVCAIAILMMDRFRKYNLIMSSLPRGLLLAFGLTMIVWPSSAQSQPPGRPPASLLHQQTTDILSQSQYQTEYPRWLSELIDRAEQLLVRALRAVFMNPVLENIYATRPVLYWLIVGALGGALLLLLYHILVTIRSAFGGKPGKTQKQTGPPPKLTTSPSQLRAEAQQLANQGDFADALVALYQACLRHLERQGYLRYRPWLTNGEYLQDLSAKPELLQFMRPLTRSVDQVVYGSRPLPAAAYRRLDTLAGQLWQEAGS